MNRSINNLMNQMNLKKSLNTIKTVGQDLDYVLANETEYQFEIYIDRYNAVAFHIYGNTSSSYIEVRQWEDSQQAYGKAVYSLRSNSDVALFCNILISSSQIRARRQ